MTDMKLLAEFVEEGLAATGILDDAHVTEGWAVELIPLSP